MFLLKIYFLALYLKKIISFESSKMFGSLLIADNIPKTLYKIKNSKHVNNKNQY